MIKYLECPDLHRSPLWADVSEKIEEAIIKAAEDNSVSFVVLPGDYYDSAVYASDKGGINQAISFIERLSKICPVIAIEGTPSHDARGSYGPLVKAGLHLLSPGKMYGIYDGYDDDHIIVLDPNKGWKGSPNAILFGIPEPDKSWLQASEETVSAEQVNAMVTDLVGQIIDREIAPKRAMLPNVPAIGLYHGNVTDADSRESETDVILKASDIVIRTSTLAKAGLDRWSLGHIHTPWESKKISAGYAGFAGIDRNPWGKTGFTPAMNAVTIDNHVVTVSRIPYGTPRREKIKEPLAAYDPNVAYWLETATDETLPEGVHAWSRVTHEETKEQSRRVDASEIETATSLSDMAKLFMPDITAPVLSCLAEIERTVKKPTLAERKISVERVKITGATFWGGKTIELDVASLRDGLTQISGANGSGKSSLAGFCSPYPCIIGKDTDSGRLSAIKDFFAGQESGIEKTIRYNGQIHSHVITIRGAHTKTPKVECYLTIDGIPTLEKSTFDEMMGECERIYGSMADYCATAFYVQPLQGKAESGLMTANMATVRDLVQSIAGIDYTKEKEYALENARKIEEETKRTAIEIDALESMIKDPEVITSDILSLNGNVMQLQARIPDLEKEAETASVSLASARSEANKAAEMLQKKAELIAKSSAVSSEISAHKTKAESLLSISSSAPMVKKAIDADAETKSAYALALENYRSIEKQNADIRHENEMASARRATLIGEIEQGKKEVLAKRYQASVEYDLLVANRARAIEKKESIMREIEAIRVPCEHCGKISSKAGEKIAILEASIPAIPETPALGNTPDYVPDPEMLAEIEALNTRPGLIPLPPLPSSGLSEIEIGRYRDIIEKAASALAEYNIIINEMIPSKTARANELALEASAINVTPVDTRPQEIEAITKREALDGAKHDISVLQANIDQLKKELLTIDESRENIRTRRASLEDRKAILTAWNTCSDMLRPAKLPAFELDTFLDSIDAEATRRVAPYQAGRFMFQTVTQKDGVDKFDILVIDKETGAKRSFLKYSVGQKSFFNKAYTDALVRVRKTRTKTEYSPIVLDEADSFIDLAALSEYYAMQGDVYQNNKVLVITHSSDAGNYINESVNIGGLVQ